MTLRIVHFSVTRMAGGPIRLVQALRKHTPHDVRLVDLRSWPEYPQDVVFERSPEEACQLATEADIIHFHNYLDMESTDFQPIDFRGLHSRGTGIIRQFRSEPGLIARRMKVPVERVRDCPLPAVVIAQFQERYYPRARVVRNNVPLDDPAYCYSGETPLHDLVFCPTNDAPANADRWNTKGCPETRAVLERLARGHDYKSLVISGQPLPAVLAAKRRGRIVLDELVTGSYHVSGLEGASLQKPTLAFLDQRCQAVLREVTGSENHPFVNVRLQEAENVLHYLLRHPDEASEIGVAARKWMEAFWSEAQVAESFAEIYRKLLDDPTRIRRQPALRLDGNPQKFFAVTLPNLTYEAHHQKPTASLAGTTWKGGLRRVKGLWSAGRRLAHRTSRLMRRKPS